MNRIDALSGLSTQLPSTGVSPQITAYSFFVVKFLGPPKARSLVIYFSSHKWLSQL